MLSKSWQGLVRATAEHGLSLFTDDLSLHFPSVRLGPEVLQQRPVNAIAAQSLLSRGAFPGCHRAGTQQALTTIWKDSGGTGGNKSEWGECRGAEGQHGDSSSLRVAWGGPAVHGDMHSWATEEGTQGSGSCCVWVW